MRYELILLTAIGTLGAQSLQLAPSTPSVTVGGSITLTSSTPVRWELSGVGKLSQQSSTSATYTAPSSIVSHATMNGCPVLPNDAVFNIPIDRLPIDSHSTTWLSPQNASTLGISFLPSWGITYADSSTPRIGITPYYGDNNGNNPTYLTPFPGRNKLKRENGAWNSGQYTANDHHTITVDRSACVFYEYYNDLVGLQVPEFTTTEPCRYAGNNCTAASEIVPYGSAAYAIPNTSTDAAGLPLAPLTWSLADIKAGPKHAIRFTSAVGYVNSSTVLWPATSYNGGNSNAAPYGSRWRLKTQEQGGPNIAAVCASNIPCSNMLTGLTHFGMMLADIGYGNQLQVAADAVSDPDVREAMQIIAAYHIGVQDFDIVDESSLQQSTANNYQVPPNGSVAVDPTNRYVTPVDYALVTATPVTGSPVSVSIALQGIGIGLQSNTMAIAAGMSGYQIPSWVTPSNSSQRVSWTLLSGAGSVTSAGFYTPPANISGVTEAVLEATAEADPNVHAFLYINVLTNNNGKYSIDLNSSAQTSSPSKIWNTDFGIEASTSNFSEMLTDYPNWVTGAGVLIPEYEQYQSAVLTYGGDILYHAILPNGNYEVRVMQGEPWNGARPPQTLTQTMSQAPEFVDVNGTIVAHYYDWQAAAGYAYGTPQDIYVPATVTDNNLTIGVRPVTPDSLVTLASGIAPLYSGIFPHFAPVAGSSKSMLASGIEVIPDVVPPHWSVDSQGVRTIAPGENIQLFLVDWHTGVNDPTWSIVTGPPGATINSNGLLSLSPASSVTAPVVVSAGDGVYSAAVVFNMPTDKQTPIISWPTPSAIIYGNVLGPAQLNATSNVAGTFSYSPSAGAMLGAGDQVLQLTFTPVDAAHYISVSSSVRLTVNQAIPPISWSAPASITAGTALTGSQLNATCSIAGNFSYDPPAGTILPTGSQVLNVSFQPADAVDYSPVSMSVTMQVTPINLPVPAAWNQVTIGSLPASILAPELPSVTTFLLSPSDYQIGVGPDAMSILAEQVPSDVSAVARISMPSQASAAAESQLMFRDSTSGTSAFVSIGQLQNGELTFEWRPYEGGSVGGYSFPVSLSPVWVKLTKSGNLLRAYYSGDGVMWQYAGQIGAFFGGSNYLVGLGSFSDSITGPSVLFDNVSIF